MSTISDYIASPGSVQDYALQPITVVNNDYYTHYFALKWTGPGENFRIRLTTPPEMNGPIHIEGLEIPDGVGGTAFINNSTLISADGAPPETVWVEGFDACLSTSIPFELSVPPSVSMISCIGGEDEVAFSLTDVSFVPQPAFTVTVGGQTFTGSIDEVYGYLNSLPNMEVVLLSRDLPVVDNGGSQNL